MSMNLYVAIVGACPQVAPRVWQVRVMRQSPSGPMLAVEVIAPSDWHRDPGRVSEVVEWVARRDRVDAFRSVGRRPGARFRVTKPRVRVGRGFAKGSYHDFGDDLAAARAEALRRIPQFRLPYFTIDESPHAPGTSEKWGCRRGVYQFEHDADLPAGWTLKIGGGGLREEWPDEFGEAVFAEFVDAVRLLDAEAGFGELADGQLDWGHRLSSIFRVDPDSEPKVQGYGWLMWFTEAQVAQLGGHDNLLRRLPATRSAVVATESGEGLAVQCGDHPHGIDDETRRAIRSVVAPVLIPRLEHPDGVRLTVADRPRFVLPEDWAQVFDVDRLGGFRKATRELERIRPFSMFADKGEQGMFHTALVEYDDDGQPVRLLTDDEGRLVTGTTSADSNGFPYWDPSTFQPLPDHVATRIRDAFQRVNP